MKIVSHAQFHAHLTVTKPSCFNWSLIWFRHKPDRFSILQYQQLLPGDITLHFPYVPHGGPIISATVTIYVNVTRSTSYFDQQMSREGQRQTKVPHDWLKIDLHAHSICFVLRIRNINTQNKVIHHSRCLTVVSR